MHTNAFRMYFFRETGTKDLSKIRKAIDVLPTSQKTIGSLQHKCKQGQTTAPRWRMSGFLPSWSLLIIYYCWRCSMAQCLDVQGAGLLPWKRPAIKSQETCQFTCGILCFIALLKTKSWSPIRSSASDGLVRFCEEYFSCGVGKTGRRVEINIVIF